MEPELLFDVILHGGTLLATFIIFRKEILKTLKSPRACLLIIVGSLPAAIIGFTLLEVVEKSFNSMKVAGVGFLITGTWLWFTRYVPPKSILLEGFLFSDITFKKAFLIGLAQGIALLPGISRSGTTIATALFLRTGRRDAATFSFLLSIPAICGAIGLKLTQLPSWPANEIPLFATGFILSCLCGLGALAFLIKLIRRGNFYKFSYYCWLVGIAALVIAYLL